MDKKFYYFGVRMKEVVTGATGATRNVDVARFAPKAYPTYEEMQAAKAKAERTRPGVSFFWQVFERELNIDAQGISHGFKA